MAGQRRIGHRSTYQGHRRSATRLTASMFFDEDGVFVETERLILKKPSDNELWGHLKAIEVEHPGLGRWYMSDDPDAERLRQSYWEEDIKGEDCLNCSIISKETDEFCGTYAVDGLTGKRLELGIRFFADYQNRGLGTKATLALMNRFQEIAGPSTFFARIEPSNERSQNLFRIVGFMPYGIEGCLTDDENLLRAIEESHLDNLDEHYYALAAEFDVEPRSLLSHVLVYKRGQKT